MDTTTTTKPTPGALCVYRGIAEPRRGQVCEVTHTGILGGTWHNVRFADGFGFLVAPHAVRVIDDADEHARAEAQLQPAREAAERAFRDATPTAAPEPVEEPGADLLAAA